MKTGITLPFSHQCYFILCFIQDILQFYRHLCKWESELSVVEIFLGNVMSVQRKRHTHHKNTDSQKCSFAEYWYVGRIKIRNFTRILFRNRLSLISMSKKIHILHVNIIVCIWLYSSMFNLHAKAYPAIPKNVVSCECVFASA